MSWACRWDPEGRVSARREFGSSWPRFWKLMELSQGIDLVFKIFANASLVAASGHKSGRWKRPIRDNSSARAKVLHGSMY